MKKIAISFLLLLSIFSSGCVFTFLGRAAGTIVRFPFEVTGDVLTGFGEGLFDTYEKKSSTHLPEKDESIQKDKEKKKTPYRDSEGNIRWE